MGGRIEKTGKPVLALKRDDGWKEVSEPYAIFRALQHPLRRQMYELLDDGPLFQSELVRSLERSTGKRMDVSRVLHHLRILERAGLVYRKDVKEGGVRKVLVSRRADIRVQIYRRPDLAV